MRSKTSHWTGNRISSLLLNFCWYHGTPSFLICNSVVGQGVLFTVYCNTLSYYLLIGGVICSKAKNSNLDQNLSHIYRRNINISKSILFMLCLLSVFFSKPDTRNFNIFTEALTTLLVASLLAVAFKSTSESVPLLQKFFFSLFPGLRLTQCHTTGVWTN